MKLSLLALFVSCFVFSFAVAQNCQLDGAWTCTGGNINGLYLGDDEDDETIEYFLSVGNVQNSNSCSMIQEGSYDISGSTLTAEFEIDNDECVISGENPSLCDCVDSLEFTTSNACSTLTSTNGDVCVPAEECDDLFSCPGGATPQDNPNVEPSSNGCGPSGLPLTGPSFSFLECCNQHDLCYGRCGASKIECDNDFYVCMFCSCDEEYDTIIGELACEDLACTYFQAVDEFGCAAFTASQEEACICPGKEETHVEQREVPSKFGSFNQAVRETELFCDAPFDVSDSQCTSSGEDDDDFLIFDDDSSNTSNTSNTSNDDDLFGDDDSGALLQSGLLLLLSIVVLLA